MGNFTIAKDDILMMIKYGTFTISWGNSVILCSIVMILRTAKLSSRTSFQAKEHRKYSSKSPNVNSNSAYTSGIILSRLLYSLIKVSMYRDRRISQATFIALRI
jgi:hypothetical protein